jgi:hypothetical protein
MIAPELTPTGSSSDVDSFPIFLRSHVSPDVAAASDTSDADCELGYLCLVDFSKKLQEELRSAGEAREVQHQDQVPLTPKSDSPGGGSSTSATAISAADKKKNANSSSDHQALIARLNKPPHIVQFKGVVLDRNERLKIIAAVALCESGRDPFSAENLDTEFHMDPSPNVSYAKIVHIGLSYGIIQFTQDSGSLGKLLERMQKKDAEKFSETFGNNSQELLTLTTAGIDVKDVDYASGQAHWQSIRKTPEGKKLSTLARMNKLPQTSEIRGKRVQPIATVLGGPRQDLWLGAWKQRFIDAGKIDSFQEAELEFAVEGFMNPALKFCKNHNVRSAVGIAYVTACAIRGAKKELITGAASELGVKTPFSDNADERKAVEYIAELNPKAANKIGDILVQKDEIIRAKTLLKDETGFLAEDLYWTDTYTDQYDK